MWPGTKKLAIGCKFHDLQIYFTQNQQKLAHIYHSAMLLRSSKGAIIKSKETTRHSRYILKLHQ